MRLIVEWDKIMLLCLFLIVVDVVLGLIFWENVNDVVIILLKLGVWILEVILSFCLGFFRKFCLCFFVMRNFFLDESVLLLNIDSILWLMSILLL